MNKPYTITRMLHASWGSRIAVSVYKHKTVATTFSSETDITTMKLPKARYQNSGREARPSNLVYRCRQDLKAVLIPHLPGTPEGDGD